MAKITLHHLENSRSFRLVWLLEELGLDYDIVKYERHPRTMLAPPELRKVHPLGKSPVLVIEDDADTFTLAESGAIMTFLVDNYGNGQLSPPPSDKKRRALFEFWMHYSEAGVMQSLISRLYAARTAGDMETVQNVVGPVIENHFVFLESTLAQQPYFMGNEFSAADCVMIYPLLSHRSKSYKAINAYLETVTQRPAYRRAMEKTEAIDPSAFFRRPQKKAKM